MDHHIARDLLGAYVDDELEAPTRAALETHLADCEDCRALLEDPDAVAPVALPAAAAAAPAWDDRRMRQAVRRTLLRTALQAAAMVVAALIVLGLVSWFVLQPGVVARGDRVERAARAAWDLPVLFIPGAFVDAWQMDASWLARDFSTSVSRYVGAWPRDAGSFQLELGVRSVSVGVDSWPPFLAFREYDGVAPPWQSEHVTEGTVATAQLSWHQPISKEDVEALVGPDPVPTAQGDVRIDADVDASLLWVAFAIEPLRGLGVTRGAWDPTVDVGYSTCQAFDQEILQGLGFAGSAGHRSTGAGTPHGVSGALDEARRATGNLAASQELLDSFDTDAPVLLRIDEAAAWLADNEPSISSIVITGPATAVNDLIDQADPDDAHNLGVDFYNWTGRVC